MKKILFVFLSILLLHTTAYSQSKRNKKSSRYSKKYRKAKADEVKYISEAAYWKQFVKSTDKLYKYTKRIKNAADLSVKVISRRVGGKKARYFYKGGKLIGEYVGGKFINHYNPDRVRNKKRKRNTRNTRSNRNTRSDRNNRSSRNNRYGSSSRNNTKKRNLITSLSSSRKMCGNIEKALYEYKKAQFDKKIKRGAIKTGALQVLNLLVKRASIPISAFTYKTMKESSGRDEYWEAYKKIIKITDKRNLDKTKLRKAIRDLKSAQNHILIEKEFGSNSLCYTNLKALTKKISSSCESVCDVPTNANPNKKRRSRRRSRRNN